MKPGETLKVKVSFKPNQVGVLKIKADIHFYPLESKYASSDCLETHCVVLSGTSHPGTEIKPYLNFNDKLMCFPRKFNAHIEWKEKMKHSAIYLEYLKQSRLEKVQHQRDVYFGKEGVQLNLQKISLKKKYKSIDKDNGLIAPEPFDFSVFDESGQFKNMNSQQQEKHIRKLFELLKDTSCLTVTVVDVFPINPIVDLKSFAMVDHPLSPTDLSNIHLSVPSIDFGNVSLHSINTIELKILNKNNFPLHFEFVTIDKDSSDFQLKVFPNHCIVMFGLMLDPTRLVRIG